jgi:hypothetical protein
VVEFGPCAWFKNSSEIATKENVYGQVIHGSEKKWDIRMTAGNRYTNWRLLGLFLGLWLSVLNITELTKPVFTDGWIKSKNGPVAAFTFPFDTKNGPVGQFEISQTMALPSIHPVKFKFYPDHVLRSLNVNNIEVNASNLPLYVDSRSCHTIDVHSCLHGGSNEIRGKMESWGKIIEFCTTD